jgi:hypothetical protein
MSNSNRLLGWSSFCSHKVAHTSRDDWWLINDDDDDDATAAITMIMMMMMPLQ